MRDRLAKLHRQAFEYMLDAGLEFSHENYADYLIAHGVIFPPVKVGQTCYYIDRADIRRPIKEELCVEIQDGYNHSVIVLQNQVTKLRFAHTFGEVGRTIFLTKDEAEKKLKEFMYG